MNDMKSGVEAELERCMQMLPRSPLMPPRESYPHMLPTPTRTHGVRDKPRTLPVSKLARLPSKPFSSIDVSASKHSEHFPFKHNDLQSSKQSDLTSSKQNGPATSKQNESLSSKQNENFSSRENERFSSQENEQFSSHESEQFASKENDEFTEKQGGFLSNECNRCTSISVEWKPPGGESTRTTHAHTGEHTPRVMQQRSIDVAHQQRSIEAHLLQSSFRAGKLPCLLLTQVCTTSPTVESQCPIRAISFRSVTRF